MNNTPEAPAAPPQEQTPAETLFAFQVSEFTRVAINYRCAHPGQEYDTALAELLLLYKMALCAGIK